MPGLDIPSRPAYEWATSLPREWARGKERLVLTLLAADHSAGTPAPGRQALADWAGLTLNQVDEALRTLASETPARPPLIERITDDGQARPAGSGRHATRFRLRTEITPAPPARPASTMLEQSVHSPVERRTIDPKIRGGLTSQPPQQPPRQPPQISGGSSTPTPTINPVSPSATDRARAPRLADLDAEGLTLATAMFVGVVAGIRPEWPTKAVARQVKTLPPDLRARHTVEDLIHAGRHWASSPTQKFPANLHFRGHWPAAGVGVEEPQNDQPAPAESSPGRRSH